MQVSCENKGFALHSILNRMIEITYLLQVCKNNWIRRIVGVKTAERRMKELSEEVRTKACIFGKTVESQVKWAVLHMVRMKDQRLPKNN